MNYSTDFSRRSWLSLAGLVTASGMLDLVGNLCSGNEPSSPNAAGERSIDESSARWTKVKSIVELKGEVRLKDPKAVMRGALKSAPIESISTLEYEEQFVPCSEGFNGPFAYRHMLEAKAENRINQQPVNNLLRPECVHVVQWMDGAQFLSNSPDQPLMHTERDLVRGALTSSFVDELLPKSAVKVGASWDLPSESARRIFQLDAVLSSSLKVTLVDADQEKAQLEISGKLEGRAADVGTVLEVRGKIQADRKSALVTWIAMNVEETREIGESEPGFRVESRLRLLRTSIDQPATSESLATTAGRVQDAEMMKLMCFESPAGGFRFLGECTWRVLHDNADQMVMRLVRNNTSLAQCNVKRLPDLEAGRQTTLEGFQEMVSRSLSESFKQFIDSKESVTDTGLRMLRTTAAGEAQGVPILWVNILLSDDQGHRASLTFTMDDSAAESFGSADSQLVGAFEFQAPTAVGPMKVETSKVLSPGSTKR